MQRGCFSPVFPFRTDSIFPCHMLKIVEERISDAPIKNTQTPSSPGGRSSDPQYPLTVTVTMRDMWEGRGHTITRKKK